jgi:hypothetical protein
VGVLVGTTPSPEVAVAEGVGVPVGETPSEDALEMSVVAVAVNTEVGVITKVAVLVRGTTTSVASGLESSQSCTSVSSILPTTGGESKPEAVAVCPADKVTAPPPLASVQVPSKQVMRTTPVSGSYSTLM